MKLDTNQFLSPDVVNIIDNHRAAKLMKGKCAAASRARARNLRNAHFDSDSDTETAIDSLFDNSNFGNNESETVGESEFEVEPDVRESIRNLELDINRITKNYVHKVKTQVEEAMCNFSIDDRPRRVQERGAGEAKLPIDRMNLLRKVEIEKQECYRKIAGILHRMKNLDNITDEIWKSNLSNKH